MLDLDLGRKGQDDEIQLEKEHHRNNHKIKLDTNLLSDYARVQRFQNQLQQTFTDIAAQALNEVSDIDAALHRWNQSLKEAANNCF
eukprot:1614164-Karenia_brevis.AAC.1